MVSTVSKAIEDVAAAAAASVVGLVEGARGGSGAVVSLSVPG